MKTMFLILKASEDLGILVAIFVGFVTFGILTFSDKIRTKYKESRLKSTLILLVTIFVLVLVFVFIVGGFILVLKESTVS